MPKWAEQVVTRVAECSVGGRLDYEYERANLLLEILLRDDSGAGVMICSHHLAQSLGEIAEFVTSLHDWQAEGEWQGVLYVLKAFREGCQPRVVKIRTVATKAHVPGRRAVVAPEQPERDVCTESLDPDLVALLLRRMRNLPPNAGLN